MEVRYPTQAREGPLAIALVNTVFKHEGRPMDALSSWDDVLRWHEDYSECSAARYRAADVDAAERAFAEVTRLRDACRAALEAHVEARATAAALAPLNALLRKHLTAAPALAASEGRVALERTAHRANGPDAFVILVAEAIVALFTTTKAQRIKHCGGAGCVLFFVDESRAGTRAWCSMQSCGNRSKAARHYERHKHAS
jgi:predicted RNA-binding Zn ribbon-like protein